MLNKADNCNILCLMLSGLPTRFLFLPLPPTPRKCTIYFLHPPSPLSSHTASKTSSIYRTFQPRTRSTKQALDSVHHRVKILSLFSLTYCQLIILSTPWQLGLCGSISPKIFEFAFIGSPKKFLGQTGFVTFSQKLKTVKILL